MRITWSTPYPHSHYLFIPRKPPRGRVGVSVPSATNTRFNHFVEAGSVTSTRAPSDIDLGLRPMWSFRPLIKRGTVLEPELSIAVLHILCQANIPDMMVSARIRYTWPLLGQNQLHSRTKIKYKPHARSPAIGQIGIVPDFNLKTPGRHLALSTLSSFRLILANFGPIKQAISYVQLLFFLCVDRPLLRSLGYNSCVKTLNSHVRT